MRSEPPGSSDFQAAGLSLLAALLLCEQVASKAARDALFLTSFDPRRLPLVMIGGAVFSFLAVLAARRAQTRFAPHLVLTALLLLSGALFALEWGIAWTHPRHAAVVVYVHVSGFGALSVSSFWTIVSERWDPHTAKRHVARLAAFTALGGVLGGLVAEVAPYFGGGLILLPVLAVGSAGTAVVAYFGGQSPTPPIPSVKPEPRPQLRTLARWPYLRTLAGLSALVAVWQALLDFAFKAAAHDTLADEAALVRFFGAFYMVTSVLTFLFQTLLGRFALTRAGLSGTAAMTPFVVVLGGVGALTGGFPFVVALRGLEKLLFNSVLRSSYELYFNPIPKAVVRATKTLVDVMATRAGDLVGALLVLALVVLETDPDVSLIVAAAVAGLALLSIPLLTRGYVRLLAAVVHRGIAPDEPFHAHEPTTRRALETPSTEVADLAAIDEIVYQGLPAEAPILSPLVAQLESANLHTVRSALRGPLDPALARMILPLLVRDEVRAEANAALTAMAKRSTGTLLDALQDPETPHAIRARIPKLLRAANPHQAVLGLLAGLEDPHLEVRLQCARGLAHVAAGGEVTFDRAQVLRAIHREIELRGAEWVVDAIDVVDDDASTLDHELHRAQIARSLRYALILVSVLADAKKLELGLRGLGSDDPAVRGTAFELLSNVLPDGVRDSLLSGLDADEGNALMPQRRSLPGTELRREA